MGMGEVKSFPKWDRSEQPTRTLTNKTEIMITNRFKQYIASLAALCLLLEAPTYKLLSEYRINEVIYCTFQT